MLDNVGRITFDEDIVFSLPGNVNSLIRTNHKVMEVKVNSNYFDKSKIEKVINLKESRFSKYCIGVNSLYNNWFNLNLNNEKLLKRYLLY